MINETHLCNKHDRLRVDIRIDILFQRNKSPEIHFSAPWSDKPTVFRCFSTMDRDKHLSLLHLFLEILLFYCSGLCSMGRSVTLKWKEHGSKILMCMPESFILFIHSLLSIFDWTLSCISNTQNHYNLHCPFFRFFLH